jgi:hypothetical protein
MIPMIQPQVSTPIRLRQRLVHRLVQLMPPLDAGAAVSAADAIVGPRQALVVGDHRPSTVLVKRAIRNGYGRSDGRLRWRSDRDRSRLATERRR